MLSTWKITAYRRKCSTANCLRASAPKEAKKCFKDTWKVSMKSFSISPDCREYLVQNRDKKGEVVKCGVKVVKPEKTKQLNCAGNLEKAMPHQPLAPPFFALTAQDSSVHRLVSLAICILIDAFLHHNVDQMVLIDYDGQRREWIWRNWFS